MNKLGIKVYPDGIYNIDNLYFQVNSIKHYRYYKLRFIKFKLFGIRLYKKK